MKKLIVLVMLCMTILHANVLQFQKLDAQNINAVIKNAVEGYNETFPKRVDAVTVFKKAMSRDNTLMYIREINLNHPFFKKQNTHEEAFAHELSRAIYLNDVDSICQNNTLSLYLLNRDASIGFISFNQEGKTINIHFLSKADCSKKSLSI